MGVYDYKGGFDEAFDEQTVAGLMTKPVEPYRPPPPPTAEESGYVGGTGKALVRGIADIPVQIGHQLQFNDDYNRSGNPADLNPMNRAGKALADTAETVRDRIAAPVYGDNEVKRSLFQGVEALPVSIAYAAPSVAGAIGGGAIAGVPGAIAGSMAGQALTAPLMYRAAGQEAIETLGKTVPNLDRKTAADIAQQYGHKEWQGEALSNSIEGFVFSRIPALKVGVNTAAKVLRPGFKQFAKNYAATLGAEQLGEGYTAHQQAEVLNQALPAGQQQQPWDAAIEQAGPTAVMSLIMAGGGSGLQKFRSLGIEKALTDPATPEDRRYKAAAQVADMLRESNAGPEAARNFLDHAAHAIGDESETGSSPAPLDLTDPQLLQPLVPAAAPAAVEPAATAPVTMQTAEPPGGSVIPPAPPAGTLQRAVEKAPGIAVPSVGGTSLLSDSNPEPAVAAPEAATPPAEQPIINLTTEQMITPQQEWAQQQLASGNTSVLRQTGETARSHEERLLNEFNRAQQRAAGTPVQPMAAPEPTAIQPPPAPAPSVTAPAAPKPVAIDPGKDSLLQAIAKLGGIDLREARNLWGKNITDETRALNTRGRGFGMPVLRAKNGRTIDDVAQALVELGYLAGDQHGKADPAELFDRLAAAARGKDHYSQLNDSVPEPMEPQYATTDFDPAALEQQADSPLRVQAKRLMARVGEDPVLADEMTDDELRPYVRSVSAWLKQNSRASAPVQGIASLVGERRAAHPTPAPRVKDFVVNKQPSRAAGGLATIGEIVAASRKGRTSTMPAKGGIIPIAGVTNGTAESQQGDKGTAGAGETVPETVLSGMDGPSSDRVPVLRGGDEVGDSQPRKTEVTPAEKRASLYRDARIRFLEKQQRLNAKQQTELQRLKKRANDLNAEDKASTVTLTEDANNDLSNVRQETGTAEEVPPVRGETVKGRDLFTAEQLRQFDEQGIDVSGVTAAYKNEALQQLTFQQEQQNKLARPDYNAEVQAEYDRIAREQAIVHRTGNGVVRKFGKRFEVELTDGRTFDFKTLDEAKRGLMLEGEGGKPVAEKKQPAAKPNTIFTEDAANKARELLRSKLNQLNSGLDPELMQAGITLAGYHIEKGARTFAAYAEAMIADLGEAVRPYLKSWYMGVKYDPRAAAFEGVDSAATVENYDVNSLETLKAATEPSVSSGDNQIPLIPGANKIDDTGEVLEGAKKHLWAQRAMESADINGMTTREMEKHVKKDKVLPPPDYQAIADQYNSQNAEVIDRIKEQVGSYRVQGTDIGAGIAMMMKEIRDSIQNPAAGWSKEQFEEYIDASKMVRDAMETVARDRLTPLDFIKHVFGDDIITGTNWSRRFNQNSPNYKYLMILGTKFQRTSQTTAGDFAKAAMKADKTGFPGKQEVWQREYRVLSKDKIIIANGSRKWIRGDENSWAPAFHVVYENMFVGSYRTGEEARAALAELKPFVLMTSKSQNFIDSFDTQEEAANKGRELYQEKFGNKEKRKTDPTPELRKVVRSGEDYRHGRDISGDDLISDFGFRGIQYGNWTDQRDRQQSLNHAYDALMDLADALGIPPKALSLNGELGIAFGARGNGSAGAHYEPSTVVINLTKTKGAGSLAHEWAHAVDDYFGRMTNKKSKLGKGYASHGVSGGQMRPEIAKAFADIMNAIEYRKQTNAEALAEAQKDIEKNTRYIEGWLQGIEREVENRLVNDKKTMTDEQRQKLNELYDTIRQPTAQVGGPEFRALESHIKEITGRLPSKEKRDGLASNLNARNHYNRKLQEALDGTVNLKNMKSNYLLKSTETGEYWARNHELFARAFDAWLYDKLTGQGMQSDYLSHPNRAETGVPEDWQGVYTPAGDERKNINAAFSNLVAALKTKETDKGVALYSNPMFNPTLIANELSGLAANIQAARPHLVNLGKYLYAQGERTYTALVQSIKQHLGNLWSEFKAQMRWVWQQVRQEMQNLSDDAMRDIGDDVVKLYAKAKQVYGESRLSDERGSVTLSDNTPDQAANFALTAEPPRTTVHHPTVLRWVKTLPIAGHVNVVETVDQLPEEAQAIISRSQIEPNMVQAMELEGTIHVITANIPDMQRVKVLVIGHELAHAGQQKKVVDMSVDWFRLTENMSGTVARDAHAVLQQVALRYGYDLEKEDEYRRAVQEATAAIAEQAVRQNWKPIGLLQRLFMYLKHWLRQHGLYDKVSDNELALAVAEMLRLGEKRLSQGQGSKGMLAVDTAEDDIKFALADTHEPADDERIASLASAVHGRMINAASGIDVKAIAQFLNPLDWSRAAQWLDDVTPNNIKRAISYIFRVPVFEAENDKNKLTFVKTGEQREISRMELKLAMWGGVDLDTIANKSWPERLKSLVEWSNGGVASTEWGKITQAHKQLSKQQRQLFATLFVEGDRRNQIYQSLDGARKNLKMRELDQETYDLYRRLRNHIDVTVASVIEREMEQMMADAGIPHEDRQRRIAEFRNERREWIGWFSRNHGEGEWVTNGYRVVKALNWTTRDIADGRQAYMKHFPGGKIMPLLHDLAKEHGVELTITKSGAVIANKGDVDAFVAASAAIIEQVGPQRVKVYVRYHQTKLGARQTAEQATAKSDKFAPYYAGEDIEYVVEHSTALTESTYGDMKNDMAVESALLKSFEKALAKGELTKEEYDTTVNQLIQDTAETLMGRAAGKYQIRRATYLIEGYTMDNVIETYDDYISGVAGMISKAQYARKQFEHYRKASAEVKPWAERYIKDSLRVQGAADRWSGNLRSLAALFYMGFRPASAVINMTQIWTLGQAELSRFTKSPIAAMLQAQKDVLADKLTAEEREIFNSAIYRVHAMQTVMAEMSGHDEGVHGKASKALHFVTDKAMALFQQVEVNNRKTMLLAAYRAFRQQGMDHDTAFQKAAEVDDSVNFAMGRYNLPGWARNPVGRTAYALQSFIWNQFNWIYNRATSGEKAQMIALLRYTAALVVIGGLAALPGGDELDKLLRRMLGKSYKLELQQWMEEHASAYGTIGEAVNDFAWHGAPSAAGVNISNALRMQIPIVSQILDGRGIMSLFGVFGGMGEKMMNAVEFTGRGMNGRAMEAIMPEAFAGPLRAYRQMTEGVTTAHGKRVFDESGKPLKYSGMDAAKRSLGFQPLEQSRRTEVVMQGQALQKFWSDEKTQMIDQLRASQPGEERKQVMSEIMKFNRELRGSQAFGLVTPISRLSIENALRPKPDKKKTRWLQRNM